MLPRRCMIVAFKSVFPSLLSLGRDGEERSGTEKVLEAVPSSGKDLRRSG